MKKLFCCVVLLVLLLGAASPLAAQEPDPQNQCTPFLPGQSCTVFFAADENVALGGNNEDYWAPFTKIWFFPAEEGKYGRVYFGFDDFNPQGGVNEQGLFFDGLAVSNVTVPPQADKPFYAAGPLIDKAMMECATVACVLDIWSEYNTSGTWNGQYLIGDRTGDAAIIEPLAVIRKEDRFLLATNFFQSTTSPEEADCLRYETALPMLEEADTFTVDLFRDILDAVHQEGEVHTLYSNVYDLTNGLIYLYRFHDFEHVVVLDVAEELAKGAHTIDLPSLFPPDEEFEAWAAKQGKTFNEELAARLADDVDPQIYEAYVGRYTIPAEYNMPYPYVDVSIIDGKLYVDTPVDARPPMQLWPESETAYFHTDYDGWEEFTVTFMLDEAGAVTGLVYEQPGVGSATFPRDTSAE